MDIQISNVDESTISEDVNTYLQKYDLADQLKKNTPLQKFYEEVHFKQYNFAESVKVWPGEAVYGRADKAKRE